MVAKEKRWMQRHTVFVTALPAQGEYWTQLFLARTLDRPAQPEPKTPRSAGLRHGAVHIRMNPGRHMRFPERNENLTGTSTSTV